MSSSVSIYSQNQHSIKPNLNTSPDNHQKHNEPLNAQQKANVSVPDGLVVRRQSSIVSSFWNLMHNTGILANTVDVSESKSQPRPAQNISNEETNILTAEMTSNILNQDDASSLLKNSKSVEVDKHIQEQQNNKNDIPMPTDKNDNHLTVDTDIAPQYTKTTVELQNKSSWWPKRAAVSGNGTISSKPLNVEETSGKNFEQSTAKDIHDSTLSEHSVSSALQDSQTTNTVSPNIIEVTNKLILHDANSYLKNATSDADAIQSENIEDVKVDLNDEVENYNAPAIFGEQNNIVVPRFEMLPESSIFKSIYNAFHLNTATKKSQKIKDPLSKDSLHLYRRKVQPHPKKIVLIGVHGFFPHKRVRAILGNPTGTSNKFIKEAEYSIREYYNKLDKNGSADLHISKIALEKEGMIFDRVEFFHEVLRNYQKELNEADALYFVSHSQGCPVTIILLSRLIEEGIIIPPTSKRKIGVLGMAGINNGPSHGGMDSTWLARLYFKFEGETMHELFHFQDFDSVQSKTYLASLKVIISCNVKVCFIGSITDQLVPLYSSTCGFAFHPNIFKSTFIDKDSNTPKFLIKVVEAANVLINMGLSDHNIIKEISRNLMGRLAGGGHSKIYFDDYVYLLGFRFFWETSDLPTNESEFNIDYETGETVETLHCKHPLDFKPYKVSELGAHKTRLPWCMRGFLCEVETHLGEQVIKEIFAEFRKWEPTDEDLIKMKSSLSGIIYNNL